MDKAELIRLVATDADLRAALQHAICPKHVTVKVELGGQPLTEVVLPVAIQPAGTLPG